VLLDLTSYRIVAQLGGHVGRVLSARWVTDGRILTAGSDGTARLWDGTTGQLRQVYRGSSRFLADATLAPGGFVVAGGADGLLRFWDPASGQLLWTLQVDKSPLLALHVDGDDIVTRGFSGELSRWTLPRSEPVIEAWEDHEHRAIVRR
jgi:WD40 repeat protein